MVLGNKLHLSSSQALTPLSWCCGICGICTHSFTGTSFVLYLPFDLTFFVSRSHNVLTYSNCGRTRMQIEPSKNREAKHELSVTWNGSKPANTATPVYLYRTLSHKTHTYNTKQKVNARSIICKIAHSKWGCRAPSKILWPCSLLFNRRIRMRCMGKINTNKLGPALHDSRLKPANIDSLHLLAGMAPDIRRTVASRTERTRQVTDTKHELHNHVPVD